MRQFLLSALLALPLCAASQGADAQTTRQAREQVEASMLVTGHVDIDEEGRVTAHALDEPDKLPDYVVDLVARVVPVLRFDTVLVDGARRWRAQR